MKKLVLLFTVTIFAICAPLAMARDTNWESLTRTWNEQQTALAKKKADEAKAEAAKPTGKAVAEKTQKTKNR
ncbi:MAG TPA: hypothetical protein VK463_20850 [Desulfomonilaceae bacterium]|nr:hypothetical protein [Desulfomonilaceae bacterium]